MRRYTHAEITYDYSDIDIEDLIEVEDVILSITHNGYIKRMPVDEYKAQLYLLYFQCSKSL